MSQLTSFYSFFPSHYLHLKRPCRVYLTSSCFSVVCMASSVLTGARTVESEKRCRNKTTTCPLIRGDGSCLTREPPIYSP